MLKMISMYYLKQFLGFKNLEASSLSDSDSEHLSEITVWLVTGIAALWMLDWGWRIYFQRSPLPHGCWQGALVFSLMGLSRGWWPHPPHSHSYREIAVTKGCGYHPYPGACGCQDRVSCPAHHGSKDATSSASCRRPSKV